MAGDTGANIDAHDALDKSPSSSDKVYENFNISAAKESSDGFPRSSLVVAEGNTKSPTLRQAVMAIKMEDFTSIHKKPCVREALLTGIGVGFGVGGIRASLGGRSFIREILDISDFGSAHFESLQLGCWKLLLWFIDHV